MRITGRTKVAGLFGYPVEHTLSPAMHNAAFGHLSMDCCYLPFPVRPDQLKQAIEAIRAMSMMGINLTIPHKEAALPYLDSIESDAAAIGAVNTIINRDGILSGHNTDGRGFLKSLEESGLTTADKQVLLIGAGGSSRALCYYLAREAGGLSLYNRSSEKALSLSSSFSTDKGRIHVLDGLDGIGRFDIIINATPLGLKPQDPLPFDAGLLRPSHVVCDLIYHRTPLLDKAESLGCRTVSGIGMLLWQGALAFELWTGVPAPVEIMRSALLNIKS